jgi:integrase
MPECPSVSETTFSGTPCASRRDAAPCRRSWNRTCGSPSRARASAKARETLGHSGIAITADVYAHLDRAQRREAADAIERAIGGES